MQKITDAFSRVSEFEKTLVDTYGDLCHFDVSLELDIGDLILNSTEEELRDKLNSILETETIIPRLKVNHYILSVQASEMHYCKPRANEGPWLLVELGALNFIPPDYIKEYAEDAYEFNFLVYCYVPIELVCKLLKDLANKNCCCH